MNYLAILNFNEMNLFVDTYRVVCYASTSSSTLRYTEKNMQ